MTAFPVPVPGVKPNRDGTALCSAFNRLPLEADKLVDPKVLNQPASKGTRAGLGAECVSASPGLGHFVCTAQKDPVRRWLCNAGEAAQPPSPSAGWRQSRSSRARCPRLAAFSRRAGSSSLRSSVVPRFALVLQLEPTAKSPMTAASRSLASAPVESALRERLATAELHHYRGHDLLRRPW